MEWCGAVRWSSANVCLFIPSSLLVDLLLFGCLCLLAVMPGSWCPYMDTGGNCVDNTPLLCKIGECAKSHFSFHYHSPCPLTLCPSTDPSIDPLYSIRFSWSLLANSITSTENHWPNQSDGLNCDVMDGKKEYVIAIWMPSNRRVPPTISFDDHKHRAAAFVADYQLGNLYSSLYFNFASVALTISPAAPHNSQRWDTREFRSTSSAIVHLHATHSPTNLLIIWVEEVNPDLASVAAGHALWICHRESIL